MECPLPECTLGQGAEKGKRFKTPACLESEEQCSTYMDYHLEVHHRCQGRKDLSRLPEGREDVSTHPEGRGGVTTPP